MSDRDAAPDPVDKAYLEAEAMLADEQARAARRARVLAAVARQPDVASVPLRVRRPAWRLSGALAAAAVGALSVLLAMHMRQAAPVPPEPAEAPAEAPPQAAPKAAAHQVETAPAEAAPARRAPPRSPPPRPPAQARSDESRPAAAEALAPPAAAPKPEIVVTARRRAEATSNVPVILPAPAPPVPQRVEEPSPPPPSPQDAGTSQARARAFPAADPSAIAASRSDRAGSLADQAEQLGAAAAAGRLHEVKALLARSVPVDAADAAGETALMKSIQAGRRAVAALLIARGASLDRENRAGESARDMAAAKGDPKLDKALGLAP